MCNPELILASGSARRRQLLSEAGYSFRVVVPDETVECGMCSREGPASIVANLAFRKAADVRRRLPHGTLIACDTLVECRGRILGKPTDAEQARDMLQWLRGQQHRVFSGLCVWSEPTGREASGRLENQIHVRVAITTLQMDRLSDTDMENYLATGAWEGKAGAFGYQDRLGWVHVVEGSESNVVGLPLELLEEMLAAL